MVKTLMGAMLVVNFCILICKEALWIPFKKKFFFRLKNCKIFGIKGIHFRNVLYDRCQCGRIGLDKTI